MRKANDLNLEERYYYLRSPREFDENGKKIGKLPIVTVCLIKDNGNISRGISICSLSEYPYKIRGRGYAKKFALAALVKRDNLNPVIREEALDALSYALIGDEAIKMLDPDDDAFFNFKSRFNPHLYPFEEKLFMERRGDK